MREKEPKNVSLESLGEKILNLSSQFKLVLIEMRKMDVKLNKIDAEQRKMGVLFEETQSQLKLTLDAYAATDRRVEELGNKFDRLETKMEEGFEFIIEKLDQKVDKVLRPA